VALPKRQPNEIFGLRTADAVRVISSGHGTAERVQPDPTWGETLRSAVASRH